MFAWDAVLVACITGGLGLVGVLVSVRGARRSSTQQHVEQTSHLVSIRNKQVELSQKVADLSDSQNVLFQMVVEVDQKVTGYGNSRNGLRRVKGEAVDF